MPINNRCTGMNFYNHISQRKDIEVKVNFEHVKNISIETFLLKMSMI